MILRDYQVEMLSRLERAWEGHRSVMVQMPTGTGKTVLMGEAIRRAGGMTIGASPLGSVGVLVVAHRRELIEQIRGTIAALGIPASLVKVTSIQKLAREIGSGEPGNWEPSLVIVDEAHHALAKTYRMLWERWPEAKFLGLTATPCRLSGEAFTDLFEVLLQAEPIQWFIDKGWLSDFEYVSAKPNSKMVKQVRTLKKRSAGDFQEKEMATVLDVPESIEHLYKTYRQFAGGKKGIVYAINRKHAEHIAGYYSSKGVRCAVIDSKTPAKERERLVEAYRGGSAIDVLVNVDIFSEGFDCPEVEFIQLARPTLSLNKYLQQVGRGMRVSKGKPHVLILDNVGLYQTFGLPTEERDWRRMFLGKATGTGRQGRIVLVGDERDQDKELVNLEMVRIKKGGRKGAGLEVFLQGTLYGVMLNGKVTCPAKFKDIVRVDRDSKFYALGVYSETRSKNYGFLYMPNSYTVDLFTVISKQGEDMGVRFYGDTYQIDGDFVCGERLYDDGGTIPNWWDSKTGNYYDYKPEIRAIHGMDFACKGTKGKFRYVTGMVNPELNLPDLYYNRFIALNKFFLVVRNDHNHAYHICGYLNDSVIVQNDRSYGYLQIRQDGSTGNLFSRLPQGMTLTVDYKTLGVRRIGEKPFV